MKNNLLRFLRRAAFPAVTVALAAVPLSAQKPPAYAFKNVQIHLADGSVQKGNIVWRDGVLESVGATAVPFDAYTLADGGDSLHAYPGLIDGSASWGAPEWPRDLPRPARMGEPPYARAGIQPERIPADVIKFDNAWIDKARRAGFTQFASSLEGKLMPGTVQAFHLSGTDPKTAVARDAAGIKVQFEASDVYPSTLMAMISRIRQLWNDATALQEHQQLYAASPSTTPLPSREPVLEALFPVMSKQLPFYFHADSKEDIERVLRLKRELGFDLVLVGAREGWMVKDELAKQKIAVLATVNLADKPKWMDVKADTSKKAPKKADPSDEEKAFREKQEAAWKADVANIKELQKAGIKVGFSGLGIKAEDVRKKLDLLFANGYDEKELLPVLTRNTAEILGLGAVSGDLKKGFQAHIQLLSKPLSDSKTTIKHHVAAGSHKDLSQQDAAPVMRGRRPSEDK
jgi:hypothetical protein